MESAGVSNGVASMNTALMHLAQNAQVKDSRWLTLEICREHQRNKCSRTENECKFAHPMSHVEVTNGRVVCCYDSIKGKCQRKEPPCKYLHPPQHLREQLLQNGRNNLILKNIQMQILSQTFANQSSIQNGGGGGGFIPFAQPATFGTPQPVHMQPYITSGLQSPGPVTGVPSTTLFGPFISANGPGGMPSFVSSVGNPVNAATMSDLLLAAQNASQAQINHTSVSSPSFNGASNAPVPLHLSHKPVVSMAGRVACTTVSDGCIEPMSMQQYAFTTAAPKRPGDSKNGLSVYQAAPSPAAIAAYQQALMNSGMHLHNAASQQAFIPAATYSSFIKLPHYLH